MTLRYSHLVFEHKAQVAKLEERFPGEGYESRSGPLQECDALTINQRLAPSAQPHAEGVHNPSDHIVAFNEQRPDPLTFLVSGRALVARAILRSSTPKSLEIEDL